MEINIKRLNDAYHLEATNESGNTLQTDGSIGIGGGELAMRPMQLMLVGIGSCSAIDVISILKKKRQELVDIQIRVEGKRAEGKVPSLFTEIHLKYLLIGDLDVASVERALSLSVDKYCSVARILEKTAKITYEYDIQPAPAKSATN